MLGAVILIIVLFALLPGRRYWGHPHGIFFGGYHRYPHHPGYPPYGRPGPRGHMGGCRRGGWRF